MLINKSMAIKMKYFLFLNFKIIENQFVESKITELVSSFEQKAESRKAKQEKI